MPTYGPDGQECPNCKKLRDELSAAKESWKSSESAKDVLLEDLEQVEAKLSEVEAERDRWLGTVKLIASEGNAIARQALKDTQPKEGGE